MSVRVIQGDCLAVLPTLEAGSVDAVITDPPYGQTNEDYDGPNAVSLRPDVWRECYRVAKDGAALVAFAGSPTYHHIATAIEAGGWKVRQMWAWVYADGIITSAWPREGFDRLAPAMDPIVYATKGKCLLRLAREGENDWVCERRTPRRAALSLSSRSSPGQATSGRGHYPKSVVASDGVDGFQYFRLARAGGYRQTDHPNEKPLALIQWLMSKLPGGLILDPFAGSGTTGIAALQEGHRAILIEREPAYVDIIHRRLKEHEPLFQGAADA